jgi:hypothetical protein
MLQTQICPISYKMFYGLSRCKGAFKCRMRHKWCVDNTRYQSHKPNCGALIIEEQLEMGSGAVTPSKFVLFEIGEKDLILYFRVHEI